MPRASVCQVVQLSPPMCMVRCASAARWARTRQTTEAAEEPVASFEEGGTAGTHLNRVGLKLRSSPAIAENSCLIRRYQPTVASSNFRGSSESLATCSYDGGGVSGPLGRNPGTLGALSILQMASLRASPRMSSREPQWGNRPPFSIRWAPSTAWAMLWCTTKKS